MSDLQVAESWFNTPGIRYRNPSTPSAFRIPSELVNGSRISIAGYIVKNASRFAINLQHGQSEEDDIFLHLNARFDDDQTGQAVVRNARFSGSWGSEERDSPDFPFTARTAFVIAINVFNDAFVVEINGNEFITFNNRSQPLANITHLVIEGSVFITDLHIPYQANQQRIDRWLSIPGVNKIGDSLTLRASTPADRNRFAVNFITGYLSSDDIAFHFNPRYDSGQIILNSRTGNSWGDELSVTNANIGDALNNFELIFTFDEQFIQTLINEQAIEPFNNRIDPTLIKYALIENDIVVENAIFNALPVNKDKYTKVTVIQSGLRSLPYKTDYIASKFVIVSGIVKSSPERFYINLQLSSHDIALHFNPRWNDQKTGGEVLLFNTKGGDEWGNETREPMILKENMYYDFIFKLSGDNVIEVIINGCGLQRNKVSKISHQFNNAEINQLEINGSIDVKQIAFVN